MGKIALITGASNGIGMELAKIHAKSGGDLVLVARNLENLEKLKSELEKSHGVLVYLIRKDLSMLEAAREVYDEVKKQNFRIDYLVNNAGFGIFGLFYETDWTREQQMINLNITALTQLTKLVLPDMIKQKEGRVLNVASTAAFQPGPLMAIYYATKAYVLFFSEAIGEELCGTGVTVTALCPGPTSSGFQAVSDIFDSRLIKGKKLPSSKEVAEYGYQAMMNGRAVAIHGLVNYLMANSVRVSPRSLVLKMVRYMQEKN